jgi:hypothetical protein
MRLSREHKMRELTSRRFFLRMASRQRRRCARPEWARRSAGADRVAVARSILLGVRAACVEPRRGHDRGTGSASIARAGRRRRGATGERGGEQAGQKEPRGDGRLITGVNRFAAAS